MQTRQAAPQVLVQQKLPFPKGEEQYTKFRDNTSFAQMAPRRNGEIPGQPQQQIPLPKSQQSPQPQPKSSISTATAKQLEDIRGSKIHQQMQQPQLLLQKLPQPNHKTSKDSSTPPPPPPLPPKIKKCWKISLNLMKSLGY